MAMPVTRSYAWYVDIYSVFISDGKLYKGYSNWALEKTKKDGGTILKSFKFWGDALSFYKNYDMETSDNFDDGDYNEEYEE